ncbi:hypothetical protein [Paraflavitalea speifideaquila]|uniref:hypothetical protein n=1 Tax=Paraflavitalea speifideaquila TaxID=3076558 RepID=UPI0028E25F4E|nr:hypothetical protein [Paraflavitalea speifideiaquila]
MILREKFYWRILCISGLFLIAGSSILAQAPTSRFSPSTPSDPIPDLRFDSISWYYRAACKGITRDWLLLPAKKQPGIPASNNNSLPAPPAIRQHKPFLTIHGNVQYNFLYRSFVDTPFAQHDFQQHTIQTSLNITIRDRLPLRVNLSQRISNSPYFRNFLDLNTQFDRFAYVKNVRQQLLDRIASRYLQHPDLSKAEQALKELTDRYNNLKKMLSSGDVRQKIVEEREKALRRQSTSRLTLNQPVLPDLTVPDLDQRQFYKLKEKVQEQATTALQPDSSYSQYIHQKKKELDSLQQRMTRMQTSTDSLRNALNKTLIQANQQVYKATSLAGLQKIATDNNLIEERPRGVERFLAHVKAWVLAALS